MLPNNKNILDVGSGYSKHKDILTKDIMLILNDLDSSNIRTLDVLVFLIYVFLLTKNLNKFKAKPLVLLFLPFLLQSSHFTGDLYSGIYHYTMDTYDIPGLDILHRNFRKHHKDVLSMENYPLSETITEIMPVGFIPLICNLLISDIANETGNDILMIANIQTILTNIVLCSAQIAHRLAHRRNHEYTKDGVKQFYIPEFVKWLQDNEIILSNKHHSKHHKTEVTNYCISNGVSSRIFDNIIDIFDLPTSTYVNSNDVHTKISKNKKRKLIQKVNNNEYYFDI
jgi:hypothetical protein